MRLLIREHSLITPEDLGGEGYRKFCRFGRAGRHPGCGVLHCSEEDDANKHWTLVTTDLEYVRNLVANRFQRFEIERFRTQRGR
jgi:hypothetical protein